VLDSFLFQQNSLVDCCINPRFSVLRGDCRQRDTLGEALRDVDCIIPLAAIVGAPACAADPTAAVSTNREAIELLLRLRSPHQRIILPNTNSGYGIGDPGAMCTEESPLRPISLYGQTKVEAELAVLAAATPLRCDWPPCSGFRRGCGLTCW